MPLMMTACALPLGRRIVSYVAYAVCVAMSINWLNLSHNIIIVIIKHHITAQITTKVLAVRLGFVSFAYFCLISLCWGQFLWDFAYFFFN